MTAETYTPVRTTMLNKAFTPEFQKKAPIEMTALGEWVLYMARDRYWDMLARSTDAAEKLLCEKTLDKINQAIGLLDWRAMAAESEKRERQRAKDAHAQQLARWS